MGRIVEEPISNTDPDTDSDVLCVALRQEIHSWFYLDIGSETRRMRLVPDEASALLSF